MARKALLLVAVGIGLTGSQLVFAIADADKQAQKDENLRRQLWLIEPESRYYGLSELNSNLSWVPPRQGPQPVTVDLNLNSRYQQDGHDHVAVPAAQLGRIQAASFESSVHRISNSRPATGGGGGGG